MIQERQWLHRPDFYTEKHHRTVYRMENTKYFKKAFDSIHRETLWTILSSYGVPDKIVSLVKCFYTDLECAALLHNKTTAEDIVIEQVENFTYLASVVSTADPTNKDIKSRLAKARSAFQRLRPIWKSKQYSRKTKIRLFNSNVKTVLLYGSECWRVTKSDMRALSSFHHGCLRQICRIFWRRRISTKELIAMTESSCIINEIKKRRFRWHQNSPSVGTTGKETTRKTKNHLAKDNRCRTR